MHTAIKQMRGAVYSWSSASVRHAIVHAARAWYALVPAFLDGARRYSQRDACPKLQLTARVVSCDWCCNFVIRIRQLFSRFYTIIKYKKELSHAAYCSHYTYNIMVCSYRAMSTTVMSTVPAVKAKSATLSSAF